jgi:two-component system, NarL family, response regulator NreC
MLSSSQTVTTTKPVRIVIADDHPFFVEGFCDALRKHPHVLVAGSAANGEELVKLVEELHPDIVFTDIQMPVKDGIAATKEIRQNFPYINIIAFSGFIEDCLITDMMDAGASGYLLKNEHISQILAAIDKVMNGGNYYSREVLERLASLMKRTGSNPMKPFNKPRFTDMELSVIKEICNGLSNKEIAQKLGIDIRAVEGAKSRIMEKTGCHNSAGIVMYAIRNYIVQP